MLGSRRNSYRTASKPQSRQPSKLNRDAAFRSYTLVEIHALMSMNEPAPTNTPELPPSEKFWAAMKQILSVPKAEIDRREAEYQKQRTAMPRKREVRP